MHNICEAIAAGIGEHGVDDESYPYVESFKRWWETNPEISVIEERFWDDENQITGKVDFIVNTPDGLAIVDLKTSSRPSKTWEAQGNAYAWLAKKAGYDIKKIFFIHLSKAGKEPKIYEYPVDESLFLSILRTFLHFYHKAVKC